MWLVPFSRWGGQSERSRVPEVPHLRLKVRTLPDPHPRGPSPQAFPGRGSMISHVQVANVMFLNPLS